MALFKKTIVSFLLGWTIGSATLCMDTNDHNPTAIEKQMIGELQNLPNKDLVVKNQLKYEMKAEEPEDSAPATWFDSSANIEIRCEEGTGGHFTATRANHLDSDQAYSSEEESKQRSRRPAEYSYSEATPHAHESNGQNEDNSFLAQCANWMFTCAGESTSYVSRFVHFLESLDQHHRRAHEEYARSIGYDDNEMLDYWSDWQDVCNDD